MHAFEWLIGLLMGAMLLSALARRLGVPYPTFLALGGIAIPASTSRGKETFFDGKVFDPENPAAYLNSLEIKKVA